MRPNSSPACPECGRPVPPQGTKLCPSCGYPLLLDRPPAVEQQPQKIVYKPTDQGPRPVSPLPGPSGPSGPPPSPYGYRPPQRAEVPGPHCGRCGRINSPHRKRCESCGEELWPGAATPARWMPQPPAIAAAPPRRRSWWKLPLLIAIPLLAVGTVWLLALLL
jgi:ribosomal protein L37E